MKQNILLEKGKKFGDYIPEEDKDKYICGKINGRVYELTTNFEKTSEEEVEFLGLDNSEASTIYNASLRFLVSMAVKEVNPKLEVRFFYNISRSFFIRVLQGKKIYLINQEFVDKVISVMNKIIALDLPFVKNKVGKEEAIKEYHKLGYQDKIQIIKYRSEDKVHLYQCTYNGKVYSDYLYDRMVPSSRYLKKFKLSYYAPGMILQVPRSELNGDIPEFKDEVKFANALSISSKWAEENHLDTVHGINSFIKNYGSLALVNICEARFNNNLSELGNSIVNSPDSIRCILVAGPSSSGKTSFANRLMFELMSRGYRPIRISMDDFYYTVEEGKNDVDIESLDAINVPLFNDLINKLVQGESVSLPQFDFKTGTRTYHKPISIGENEPMIIEGIHALSPLVLNQISYTQKFRIYISPQPQVNLDNHTPLSMTYMRLLRRIARDSKTRNSDAKETIEMWSNVRKGEFKYIYPNQENADYVFDSFMQYELCALRNSVLPLLDKIKVEDNNYAVALRLKQMVKYFAPISTSDIPCNSVIREFVGGSCFKDAR